MPFKAFLNSLHTQITGTYHQVLVCRHLRPGSRDKQQSLVVALLRAKQERLLSSRKRWVECSIVTIQNIL